METKYIWVFVAGAILASILIAGYRTYTRYAAATGSSRFTRFMAVFQQSGTILWARILVGSGTLTTLLGSWTDWFNGSPQIQDAIRSILPDPKWWPLIVIILGVLTEYIRRRPQTTTDGTLVTTLAPPVDPNKTTGPNPPPIGAEPVGLPVDKP